MEINKNIDDVYFEIMDEINSEKQNLLNLLKNKSEIFEQNELNDYKKILNEETKIEDMDETEILGKRVKQNIRLNKNINLKDRIDLNFDNSIKIWDPLTGQCKKTLNGHTAVWKH